MCLGHTFFSPNRLFSAFLHYVIVSFVKASLQSGDMTECMTDLCVQVGLTCICDVITGLCCSVTLQCQAHSRLRKTSDTQLFLFNLLLATICLKVGQLLSVILKKNHLEFFTLVLHVPKPIVRASASGAWGPRLDPRRRHWTFYTFLFLFIFFFFFFMYFVHILHDINTF